MTSLRYLLTYINLLLFINAVFHLQVMERNALLFLLISLEEFRSKPIVCVQFYLWNILGLLRFESYVCMQASISNFKGCLYSDTLYNNFYKYEVAGKFTVATM